MKYSTLLLCFFVFAVSAYAEEGMYPLSEIHKLNLKEKGFLISANEIYNPNGISLVDASVNVGGCSGSFISGEGLIITNHHCVFGATQQASSIENDYVKNGFIASDRSKEIPAKGLTVRIVESYRDVSKEVLAGITEKTDPVERTKTIERNSKQLVAEVEKKTKNVRASVAEMFAGKTYVLFVYKTIRDVRLVYVPPRSIGEFGGEDDNWIWPRHTGDFSFVRAYVAKDGSVADFSPENVPYVPKKHYVVNPEGVNEGDRVFILGYPGRTYRHQTSFYLEYENDIRLKYIQERYAWMIQQMEAMGKSDPAVALTLSSRIKSLANVEKNYRGKLKGLRNLPIIQNKKDEEKALQAYIDLDASRKKEFGDVLSSIRAVYDEMRSDAASSLVMGQLMRSATLIGIANNIVKAVEERQKPDLERQTAYMDKNLPALRQSIASSLHNLHLPADKLFLKNILLDAAGLPEGNRIQSLTAVISGRDTLKSIQHFVDSVLTGTQCMDTAFVFRALSFSPDDLLKSTDPLIAFVRTLQPELEFQNAVERKRTGELNRLAGKLVEIKAAWKKTEFIPDANSTLRLTYGRIRGYSPADAVYYSPITTLKGVIEKTTEQEEYNTPQRIRDLYKKKDFGRYKHKTLNDIPVALLYDMDTTGGNSGSPVLNAQGELVGVNFDRAFEATVNDYAWNELYSRSIAVDIRYVLWNVEKVGGADFLIKEMGIH